MAFKAHIESLVSHSAPNLMTSIWIEEELSASMELLGFKRGSLERLTGIKERRFWDHDTKYFEMAAIAGQKAIDQSGIDPQEIGCVINTSVCRDYIEPSQAVLVHGKLKLSPDCLIYDITNACLGFVNAMDMVRRLVEDGTIKYGLIVSAEGSIKAMENTIKIMKNPDCSYEDYKDNFATLTIGSGAVGMIISRSDVAKTTHVINGSVTMNDTLNGDNLCFAFCDHTQMIADPQALLKFGMPLAVKTWEKARQTFDNWTDETIDVYIPHQTSSRHVEAFIKNCKLTPEKMHLTLPTIGNTISAALPMTLVDAHEKGRLKEGNHIALMGIGSGLNCTMMSVTW